MELVERLLPILLGWAGLSVCAAIGWSAVMRRARDEESRLERMAAEPAGRQRDLPGEMAEPALAHPKADPAVAVN